MDNSKFNKEKLRLLESIAYLADGEMSERRNDNKGDARRWRHKLYLELDKYNQFVYENRNLT